MSLRVFFQDFWYTFVRGRPRPWCVEGQRMSAKPTPAESVRLLRELNDKLCENTVRDGSWPILSHSPEEFAALIEEESKKAKNPRIAP